jgi:predicted enzyme related to lactoylglutathione lyase
MEVAEGQAGQSDTRTHQGRLVWRQGAAVVCGEPQNLRLLFQQAPEPKQVKNRLHLDLRTGDADVEAVRRGLVERGATVLHEGRQGPHTWVTMTDPEGNEFCV